MSRTERILAAMSDSNRIRNIAICAHIDHGKTTLSDSLLVGGGMLSSEIAGTARALDYRLDEITRGITIDAASVNMIAKVGETDYLINLVDTPGHVDFGGEVTRAMRAVDGCIILVCAIEGIMPQTETVIKQALREDVKPILFINKIDRLITESKLDNKAIQEKIFAIIKQVNVLITQAAPTKSWSVNLNNSSVCFGSASDCWALNVESDMSLVEVIDAYKHKKQKELLQKIPLHQCVFSSVVSNIPSPVTSTYRIPTIWKGDLASVVGRALVSCDPNGPTLVAITKVEIDDNGTFATGRIFCGNVNHDMTFIGKTFDHIFIRNGAKKERIESAGVGNIITLSNIDVKAGETLSTIATTPFIESAHQFETVLTKAIDVVDPNQLARLDEVLSIICKEDPLINVELDTQTGERKISGLGELHLDVVIQRIKDARGVDVRTSAPIVLFKESVLGEANQHYVNAGLNLTITVCRNASFENILDCDIQNEHIDTAFEDCMKRGPLCFERCSGVIVQITGVIHPACDVGLLLQAVRDGIRNTMLAAKPVLLMPMQLLLIEAPLSYVGALTKLFASKFADIVEMNQTEKYVAIKSKIAVNQTLGLLSDIKKATNGFGSYSVVDQSYEPVNNQEQMIDAIRMNKGIFRK